MATPPTTSSGAVIPWRTMALLAAGVGVEVVLLDRLVGEQALRIPEAFGDTRWLRKDLLVAVLAAAGLFFAHVRGHLDAYRLAPLPVSRVVRHGAVFAALLAFLLTMAADLPQRAIGVTAARGIAAGLFVVWLTTLPTLLPGGIGAGKVTAGIGLAAAAVLAAIRFGTTVSEAFWYVTGDVTVWLVERLITPFAGAPVVRPRPLEIGTQDFQVYIGAGCSGYQGITLIILLFAGYLWWFRRLHRFPQSFLLFPLGIGLIFLSNAVRIAALILVGIWISPQIAVDGFHSQAGWVAFLVVGLGLIALASRMRFFTRADATALEAAGPGPVPVSAWRANVAPDPLAPALVTRGEPGGAASSAGVAASTESLCPPTVSACLFPFLALLATMILTGAFAVHGSLDRLYPVRVVVVAAVLWTLRHEFRWREATCSPWAIAIGAGVFILWMLLSPSIANPDPLAAAKLDPAQLGMPWGSVWLAFRLVGYLVTVPIAEELAFRGFLARRLISEDVERVPVGTFTWLSLVGSAVAFGAMHGGDWFPGILAGAAFAAALYLRRQLADAIVAHATTNALLSYYAIVTGAWNALG